MTLAVTGVLIVLGAWVLLIVLVLVLGRLVARTRHSRRRAREGGVVAVSGGGRRGGGDRRSGRDRRAGPDDRRAALPDPRSDPTERRAGEPDRRRGRDRRSGLDRRALRPSPAT
jgi:hypothetical protein